jgi:hypothetical protein
MSRIEVIIARSPVAELMSRHKRGADAVLYRVLADCMEICEICERDPFELDVLNLLITELPLVHGNKRLYVEKGSDTYQRTCRFMFHGEEHTANINRYAIALREAARQGVKSRGLIRELSNGGINKFFLSRPTQAPMVATKCLRLDRQIRHRKGDVITLRLKRDMENVYRVLDMDPDH